MGYLSTHNLSNTNDIRDLGEVMGYNISENIWFSYVKDEYTLRGINLEAKRGEVTALVGPTGCGKSTLLIIAGLLKPDKGMVYYNDIPITNLLPKIRKDIGILFQDPDDQLFNPTIYDEIAFALRSLNIEEHYIRNEVLAIAKELRIERLLNKSPFRLSIGEKRKVALASILVYNPTVLILDEPTANLDYETVQLMNDIIFKAKDEGRTIIVASHDLDFIIRTADTVYSISNGLINVKCKGIDLLREENLKRTNLQPPLLLEMIDILGIDRDLLIDLVKNHKLYHR